MPSAAQAFGQGGGGQGSAAAKFGGGGGGKPPIWAAQPLPKKKKGPAKHEHGFWGAIHEITGKPGDIVHAASVMAAPIEYILGHHTHGPTRTAANVLGALGTSPVAVVAHPEAAAKNLSSMVVGLGESPYAIPKSIMKYGLHKTLAAIYHSTVADYKNRYGSNWEAEARKNPLFNLSDLFMFLGPAMGAGVSMNAAKELGVLSRFGEESRLALAARGPLIKGGASTAWEDLSNWQKFRVIREEAKHPGMMTEGAPKTRDLSLQIGAGDPVFPEGKWIDSSQPLARGPLRRGIQTSLDDLASRFPDLPMAGARSRIVRANAAQLPRAMDRYLGSIVGFDALKGLSKVEKTRLWAQAQLVKHVVDPETGAIIHDHAAVTAKIHDLRNALAAEFENKSPHHLDEPQLQDWLLGAKQHGFGKALLKRLDDAAAYEPKAGGRYERSIQPLIHATNVSEQVIKDTNGHTWLGNDQKRLFDRLKAMADENGQIPPEHADAANHIADQLQEVNSLLASKGPQIAEMLPRRRRLLLDWVNAHTPVDAPERAAWGKALSDKLGWEPQQVQDALMLSDMKARAARPENPASFYAEKMGTPVDITPEQLGVRASTFFQDFPEQGLTHLIEGEAVAPAKTTAYYSGIQKELADNWGPKKFRQAGAVRKTLKEGKHKQEYDNMELDNFFDQHDKNTMISQEDLHQFLATPLNRYNIREVHLVNSAYARDLGYGTAWGDTGPGAHEPWSDELLSRRPGEGEYHEIPFDLPQGTIHPDPYQGKGEVHWGAENVVGHVRFQVFEEGGKTKLLIEEVQSDWARQFVQQEKTGRKYGPRNPNWENARQALMDARRVARIEYEDANYRLHLLQSQRDEIRTYLDHYPEGSTERETVQTQLNDVIQQTLAAEHRNTEAADSYHAADMNLSDHMQTRTGNIPPPPASNPKLQRLGVHRILRHAAENGIDEVIVIDEHTQNARNLVGPPGVGTDGGDLWHEIISGPSGAERAVDTKTALSLAEDQIGSTHFTRVYGKEIPDLIEKRTGIKGQVVNDAYQGHIGTQEGLRTSTGPMRGTVYKLDDAARAKAVEPDLLYQHQPEWGKQPRGANELLAGKGHRLIHMFRTADISTWVHELAHSAVFDLPEADANVILAHYGEGAKAITSMSNAAHENFGRDFERFFRTGDLSFLPRPVQEVFLRIQAWMQRVYRETKAANPEAEIPQEVQDVFGRMLHRDQGDTPDIFMPHRAGAPELTGARTSRGVPRAGRDIGDYTQSRVPIYARNNLGLVRSGLVHDDPLLAVEHVNRLVSLQKANQLREFLLDKATPLMPGQTPNLETQYVIKRAGTSIDKPLYDALASAHNPEEIRTEIAKYIDENISADPQVVEGWKGKQQLYTIDKQTVDMLFKYVTGKVPGQATKPTGPGQQVIDATLNSMRGLLLYANPGFYVANFVGNLGMQIFNDPRSLRYLPKALKEASAQATHGRLHTVDPVFERVNIEMGRGPTSGGLSPERSGILGPELGVAKGPLAGRAAERVTHGLHKVGATAGSLVDDAFRVSTWRQEASKLGYRTDAEVLKLLDQGVKDTREHGYMATGTKALDDLAKIRDRASQLMLDFDSMTPFEKTWLNRIIFLYPFLKASAKYPAMFAGEHPFTFGAAAQTSNVGQQFANQILGPRPNLPIWAQGYARGPGGMYNLGAIDQMSVLGSMIESATHIGRKTPVGINTPWEYLPPIMQLAAEAARGQNRYGRESGIGPILRTDLAVPAWISALYRDPSKLYTQQGEYGALLRSLRLAPFGVNPDYGANAGG